uniref:DUF7852 domain-containing protein n=1 Tax=Geobacillus sp. (strain Y4.1MC1) TaxID=581103 RepID=A0A7U3YIR0_GEOS0
MGRDDRQTNRACPVTSTEQTPLSNDDVKQALVKEDDKVTLKVPVVLAERTIQVVVESDISLDPPATEIKRVTKNVFLEQVKLVPVEFDRIHKTDFFEVKRAKLFVSGFIRKDIEYASSECNGALQDRIANIPFSGFTELKEHDFLTKPIIGISGDSKAFFLNEKNDLVPRLDKYFFQNLVKYNEQPYGELVAANFYELDFSPTRVSPEEEFDTLREKIVLDLTIKVLQIRQAKVKASTIVPNLPEGTIGH